MTRGYTATESWTYTDDKFRSSMSLFWPNYYTPVQRLCGFWVGVVGTSFFLLVSRSKFTVGWSKFQKGLGCQKEGGSNINEGVFFFLFYQSKLMSHFVSVIAISSDTTLKERSLGLR